MPLVAHAHRHQRLHVAEIDAVMLLDDRMLRNSFSLREPVVVDDNYVFRRSKDRRQMSYYSEVIVNKDMVKEVRMLGLADNFIGRCPQQVEAFVRKLEPLFEQAEESECKIEL